jgi:hypothetical protein
MDWRARFLAWTSIVSIAGFAVEVYWFAHYAAPMTCVLLAIVLLAMRRIRRLKFGDRAAGLFLSRAIPLACLLMLALRAGAVSLHMDTGPVWPPTWYNSDSKKIPRSEIEGKLETLPGQHLVIVGFKPGFGEPHEWVYNAADIDASKIVWAWDMGEAKNQELLDYFHGRKVWRVALNPGSPQE